MHTIEITIYILSLDLNFFQVPSYMPSSPFGVYKPLIVSSMLSSIQISVVSAISRVGNAMYSYHNLSLGKIIIVHTNMPVCCSHTGMSSFCCMKPPKIKARQCQQQHIYGTVV